MKTLRIGCGLLACVGASWAQQYVISTIAGGVPPPTPTLASGAPIGGSAVSVDSGGNVYFTSLNCVFKVDQNGILTVVAGNSRAGYSGDGGPAASAQLNQPTGIAIDPAGNLFIAEFGSSRIRKVSLSGIITTVAGNGISGFSGDGGPATDAALQPMGVVVDASDTLYIAEFDRIRKVSPSGIITTIAGIGPGTNGFSGDGGQATSASIDMEVVGGNGNVMAVDPQGNLYFADYVHSRIREVSAAGIITTIAGNGTNCNVGCLGDGGPATSAQVTAEFLTIDGAGNLYVAGYGVRKFTPGGTITTVVPESLVPNVLGIAVDRTGNLYYDSSLAQIQKINTAGEITAITGGESSLLYAGEGVPATTIPLGQGENSNLAVTMDNTGNLYVADNAGGRIRKISPAGIINTVAGGGTQSPGDGGPPTSAQIGPRGVAVYASGNIYFSESNRVRKVSSGIITTIATVSEPLSSNSGLGGIAVDSVGNVYAADYGNSAVIKVTPAGILSTVVGISQAGYSGDGGPAAEAQLSRPTSVAFDGAGNLYIADSGNGRVRVVAAATQVITTLAGGGTQPPLDGASATSVLLNHLAGLFVDQAGDVYVADSDRILKVTAGVITIIAGNGSPGYSGDGGAATQAQFGGTSGGPFFIAGAGIGITADGSGNVYVADSANGAVRFLKKTNASALVSAVFDAASESAVPVSPGKIVVIYGEGLGPSQLVSNQPSNGVFGTQLAGTTVSFNGTPAPLIYTSATQLAAIVPYEIVPALFTTAQVTVSYQGSISSSFSVPLAASAPSLFTANQTGAGQIATINATTGAYNDAAHPAKVGDFLELFATGEGQTTPAGVDGKLATVPYPTPNLPVSVTVGGIPATVSYKGGAPTEVAGLMQVNIQIPPGVQPGGYVPIVLTVGTASTVAGALWIAVAGN